MRSFGFFKRHLRVCGFCPTSAGGLFLAKRAKEACENLLMVYLEKGCGERDLEPSDHFEGDGEDPDEKLHQKCCQSGVAVHMGTPSIPVGESEIQGQPGLQSKTLLSLKDQKRKTNLLSQ